MDRLTLTLSLILIVTLAGGAFLMAQLVDGSPSTSETITPSPVDSKLKNLGEASPVPMKSQTQTSVGPTAIPTKKPIKAPTPTTSTTPTPTTTTTPTPTTEGLHCAFNDESGTVGQEITFTSSSTGNTSQSWSAPSGTPTSGSDKTFKWTPSAEGEVKITLSITGSGGSTTCDQTITVSPSPTPTP